MLHVELTNHFDQFEKHSHMMREIDQELCHHTGIAGWDLVVWPLQVCSVTSSKCTEVLYLQNVKASVGIRKEGARDEGEKRGFKKGELRDERERRDKMRDE